MNNTEKPVPLTMSAERPPKACICGPSDQCLKGVLLPGFVCKIAAFEDLREAFQEHKKKLDAQAAALAETRERLLEVSQKWLNAASERDELLPIKAERDALQDQLTQAQADTKRLEHAMNHMFIVDSIGPRTKRIYDSREAIDAALRAKQEPPKKGEHDPAWDKTAQEFLQDALNPKQDPPVPEKGERLQTSRVPLTNEKDTYDYTRNNRSPAEG